MCSGLQFVQFEEKRGGMRHWRRLFLRATPGWMRFGKKLRTRPSWLKDSVFQPCVNCHVPFSSVPVWGSGQSCWRILELHSWWWGLWDSAGLSEHRSKDGRCSCSLLQRVLSACAQKSSWSTGGDGNSHSHFPKPEGRDAGDKINQAYKELSMDNLKPKNGAVHTVGTSPSVTLLIQELRT